MSCNPPYNVSLCVLKRISLDKFHPVIWSLLLNDPLKGCSLAREKLVD